MLSARHHRATPTIGTIRRHGVIGFIALWRSTGPLRDYIGIALTIGTIQFISSGHQPLVATRSDATFDSFTPPE